MNVIGQDAHGEALIKHVHRSKSKDAYFAFERQVYPVGETVSVVLRPSVDFFAIEGAYQVKVLPLLDFDDASACERLTVRAEDNRLAFSFCFPSEQAYLIVVEEAWGEERNLIVRTCVYALEADLFELLPLKGDLHCHSICSDGLESPALVAETAERLGFDFLAVTDHNSYEGSVLARLHAREQGSGLIVLPGEEYSCSFTPMHIVSLGGRAPLAESFYAPESWSGSAFDMTKRLLHAIAENGGVSVMCHPLWKAIRPDGSRKDTPLSLIRSLLRDGCFDAVEIVSGASRGRLSVSLNTFQIALVSDAAPENIAYLGVTDSHMYSIDAIAGRHLTVVFARERSEQGVLDAIREKRTVAVQIDADGQAHCFGSLRLCRYAEFLLRVRR